MNDPAITIETRNNWKVSHVGERFWVTSVKALNVVKVGMIWRKFDYGQFIDFFKFLRILVCLIFLSICTVCTSWILRIENWRQNLFMFNWLQMLNKMQQTSVLRNLRVEWNLMWQVTTKIGHAQVSFHLEVYSKKIQCRLRDRYKAH